MDDSVTCNDSFHLTQGELAGRVHAADGTCMTDFTRAEIDVIYKVMAERRDMRHFSHEALPTDLLQRLLEAAHLAPSVGLMQPWRFIHVRDRRVRMQIHALVEEERSRTALALGEREEEFMRLKVEGILECGELLVAGLAPDREKHVFGRRTMPEMDLASVACAIQNMWLAARAEGIGLGWVSLFEPEALRALLRMPLGSKPIAVLCLGRVPEFYPRPMLEMNRWKLGCSVENLVHTDYWGGSDCTHEILK
jgi:5,6-dimethylbenzimidazole synthase